MRLGLVAIVVDEYDPAIEFFVGALGFELVQDSPATTNDGRPKRWVVVRPPGAATGVTGGAVPREGGGLRGIEQRLAPFDGVIAVTSPPGGPTLVTMELPCELSSART